MAPEKNAESARERGGKRRQRETWWDNSHASAHCCMRCSRVAGLPSVAFGTCVVRLRPAKRPVR